MRIGIVTLGCDKNVVDNEYLAGLLHARGCQIETADLANPPDLVVINTCGFIDTARQLSLEEIQRWTSLRRKSRARRPRVAVIGCLAQRMGEDLARQAGGGVDFIAGVGQFERVAELLAQMQGEDEIQSASEKNAKSAPNNPSASKIIIAENAEAPNATPNRALPRMRLDSAPHSYLKIADGCDHSCSFCSIPLMKGKRRSVARPILIEEARRLVGEGVRELNLIAQDTSLYGLDTEGRAALPALLEDLSAIPGDFWIRIFYLYPNTVTNALIEAVAALPKVVKYLDIPLQHLDAGVLGAMRRPDDPARILDLLRSMRERIPSLILRTTFIVGFPGETESAFKNLLDGMEQIRFERAGAFCYSEEPDTPAASFLKQVSPKTSAHRFDRLMRLQAEISAEWTASQIGSTRRVLIEAPAQFADAPRESARKSKKTRPQRETPKPVSFWTGRSYSEAPDVDGLVIVRSAKPLQPGQFVDVRITGADVYDFHAEAL